MSVNNDNFVGAATAIADLAAGGAVGSATGTVDSYVHIELKQSSPNQAVTLPVPSVANPGLDPVGTFVNSGPSVVNLHDTPVPPGSMAIWKYSSAEARYYILASGGFLPGFTYVSADAAGEQPKINGYNFPATPQGEQVDGSRWVLTDYGTPYYAEITQQTKNVAAGVEAIQILATQAEFGAGGGKNTAAYVARAPGNTQRSAVEFNSNWVPSQNYGRADVGVTITDFPLDRSIQGQFNVDYRRTASGQVGTSTMVVSSSAGTFPATFDAGMIVNGINDGTMSYSNLDLFRDRQAFSSGIVHILQAGYDPSLGQDYFGVFSKTSPQIPAPTTLAGVISALQSFGFFS